MSDSILNLAREAGDHLQRDERGRGYRGPVALGQRFRWTGILLSPHMSPLSSDLATLCSTGLRGAVWEGVEKEQRT
ncbi:hypothetical protein N7478_005182 [Penicillium angulare]|uniref:uncharacterized protein n=1 Tax=Penicillium angulare TaxID=116970 RepID=UPI0025422E27|nr:uncharacterized protein N7478_005182 [Penicillium angulare]KAJ5279810.1 hypothetical protein N7478_005182 [Penicillium angulare]